MYSCSSTWQNQLTNAVFRDKNVLVTGANGMIGKELVEQLLRMDAIVHPVDLKNGTDLRNYQTCLDVTKGMDFVFHLAGIKGSPKMTEEKPIDFMGPMLQFDSNMIIASQENDVKRFLYTSSIAVEHPERDHFPAWAKRTGEELINGMRIQYPFGTNYTIVRPANVYGRYDNFDNPNAMVVTSLIKKGLEGKLDVWGDGSQVRDFINSKDVARGMILTMKNKPLVPVNLCSGKGYKISQVAGIISDYLKVPINYVPGVVGDKRRVMKDNGDIVSFYAEVGLKEGITEAIECVKLQ